MNKLKKVIKFIFSWGVIAFFGWLIYKNIGDYSKLVTTVRNADFVLVGWGAILAIGNYALTTSIFKVNYSIFTQEDHSVGKILPEMIVFAFMGISNPIGFAGAAAYFAQKLKERGLSAIHCLFAIFSMQLTLNISLLPLIGISFWFLSENNNLKQYEIYSVLFLILLVVIIISVMVFLTVLPHFSRRVSKFVAEIINKISKAVLKTRVINIDKLDMRIDTIQDISKSFDHSPKKYLWSFLLALIYHSFNILILNLAFRTYNDPISITALIILYSMIALFTIISPNAQGIGIVEGVTQLIAISIGIPSETAIVSILTYRVMTLWFPALFGMIVYKFRKQPSVPATV